MTILLIDDSKVVHSYLSELLEGTGLTLAHAFCGEDGIELSRRNPPGLIFLDWEMPGIQGIDVLPRLRADGFRSPIVMLTTKNKPAEITRAMELGATEYIMKPFTRDILLEKLQMVGVL